MGCRDHGVIADAPELALLHLLHDDGCGCRQFCPRYEDVECPGFCAAVYCSDGDWSGVYVVWRLAVCGKPVRSVCKPQADTVEPQGPGHGRIGLRPGR